MKNMNFRLVVTSGKEKRESVIKASKQGQQNVLRMFKLVVVTQVVVTIILFMKALCIAVKIYFNTF